MRTSRTIAVLALALVLAGSTRIAAWGQSGHHIVARIALAFMTPDATRAATDILAGDDFVAASTWADEIRPSRPETANWHFVDIPYGADAYDAARDCSATEKGDCVIAEIARARAAIVDASLSADARKESLKFLIHFVGDLHQPLHDVDDHDRGGNDVHTSVAGYTSPRGNPNLHSVWDSVLIGQRHLDEDAYLALLLADLREHPIDAAPIDVVAWSNEAHAIARTAVYTYAGFSADGPSPDAVALDDAYQQHAAPIIDRQLERAGVRLAAILNEAFAVRR
jgi:nuclease S1